MANRGHLYSKLRHGLDDMLVNVSQKKDGSGASLAGSMVLGGNPDGRHTEVNT